MAYISSNLSQTLNKSDIKVQTIHTTTDSSGFTGIGLTQGYTPIACCQYSPNYNERIAYDSARHNLTMYVVSSNGNPVINANITVIVVEIKA